LKALAENWKADIGIVGAAPGFVQVEAFSPFGGFRLIGWPIRDFCFITAGEKIFLGVPDEAIEIFLVIGADHTAWRSIDQNHSWQHIPRLRSARNAVKDAFLALMQRGYRHATIVQQRASRDPRRRRLAARAGRMSEADQKAGTAKEIAAFDLARLICSGASS
jgi:hypothetical protein